jgi:glycosyltransferase involved in cell wall biosynthesis
MFILPLFIVLICVFFVVSFIGYLNFFTATRLSIKQPKRYPKVSILIPARNEEKNIGNCLDSVLEQDHTNYEVIVCDDKSEDDTGKIVKSYLKDHKNLRLIEGKLLPEDWTGKNWACQQLSSKAKGEVLLFLDADVTLEPQALSSAIALMQKKKVSMLSVFPLQRMSSIGEWLVVPTVDWLSLTFIPYDLVYRVKSSIVSIAIGQFILVKRKAYDKMGQHEAVRRFNVEDVMIARKLKKVGERIMVARSHGLVSCYMYNNFRQSVEGLSRSYYNGAHMHPVPYCIYLSGLIILFFTPLVLAMFDIKYLLVYLPMVFSRIATSLTARQSFVIDTLLAPVHGLVGVGIAINSIYITMNNKIEWKGRKIVTYVKEHKFRPWKF